MSQKPPPSVSIIIVSRGRPQTLMLCLNGVSRLHYQHYEIIVVADPEGADTVRCSEFADKIKLVEFDQANISLARNLGIAAARGDIIAFIDDDAVPEPTWLTHLVQPFETAKVAAVGGFVRGRNGITFQYKARQVDQSGLAIDIEVDETQPTTPTPRSNHAIKTEGTNMALRRIILAEMGGFDPVFRFYLDETDLNMRLATAGHQTAISPLAEVHHAYAPSVRRKASRAAIDLTEIGASLAVFLRKHCPQDRREHRWEQFQQEHTQRAIEHMISGLIEPRDIARVLQTLRDGYTQGQNRTLNALAPIEPTGSDFLSFQTRANGESQVLAGRIWSKRRLRKKARILASQGVTVSVFTFTHTALFHWVRFRKGGYWEQRGGLFGRSARTQDIFQVFTLARRLRSEVSRVARQRGL